MTKLHLATCDLSRSGERSPKEVTSHWLMCGDHHLLWGKTEEYQNLEHKSRRWSEIRSEKCGFLEISDTDTKKNQSLKEGH